ncbi:MAG: hypothetical protein ACI3W7_02860 [Oscillospiraceae bacterium]
MREETPFVGYEYKELTVPGEQASMHIDCYECFGWELDENIAAVHGGHTTIRMKRNRKIMNKAELTRLQRHFEACVWEINELERAKTSAATVWALVIGMIGTAFMAGSVFAVTHNPPLILLCIVLAVPAFLGWIAPYFVYRRVVELRTKKLQPVIEAKQDEIYEICEKGHSLL